MRSSRVRIGAIGGGLLAIAAAASISAPITDASTAADPVTTTFAPIADTFVADYSPNVNFGTRTALSVDASAVKRTFLAFTVTGLTEPVARAMLRLHVDDISGAGSDVGGTWTLMSDTTWSETAVTWNAQPAIDGAALGTLGPVARNTWVQIDVTSQIAGDGTYSIGGTSTSADGVEYDSRETGATAPQLVITTGTIPADPVLVGAGDISDSGPGDSQTAALINNLPDATVYTAATTSTTAVRRPSSPPTTSRPGAPSSPARIRRPATTTTGHRAPRATSTTSVRGQGRRGWATTPSTSASGTSSP